LHNYTAFEENSESRYWESSGKIAKYVADKIEQQHRFFTSLLYSLALAISIDKIIKIILRYVTYKMIDEIMINDIVELVRVFVIFSLFSIALYYIILGGYCANVTLAVSIVKCEDWKSLLKRILSFKDTELASSAEKRGFYMKKTFKEGYLNHHGEKREYIMFFHDYRGVIRLTIKTFSFKVEDRVILAMSMNTGLFGVFCPLLREWMKGVGRRLKREEVIEVDPWYEVMEDFTLFFDDLFKAFENFGIKLKESIP